MFMQINLAARWLWDALFDEIREHAVSRQQSIPATYENLYEIDMLISNDSLDVADNKRKFGALLYRCLIQKTDPW